MKFDIGNLYCSPIVLINEAKFVYFYPLDKILKFRLNEYRLKLLDKVSNKNMTSTAKSIKKVSQGFTLIELLVVIAVIGVLAGAIIVAINPTEQLNRAADAGKKSTAQQIAAAINGYYASTSSLPSTPNFISTVVASGDLKVLPALAATATASTCVTNGNTTAQNGYCYTVVTATANPTQTDFVVSVLMQSIAEKSKCATSGVSAYYAYSSYNARAGSVCGGAAGIPPVGTNLTFN